MFALIKSASGARTVAQYQFTTSLPGAPSGEYVVLQYHAVAGTGFVTETVVLQRDGTRGWRAAGYFVKPEQRILEHDPDCNRDVRDCSLACVYPMVARLDEGVREDQRERDASADVESGVGA